jgi:hypothetical protein
MDPIRDRLFPVPGSQTLIYESFVPILEKFNQIFFVCLLKNKIIFSVDVVKLITTKKDKTTNFSPLLFCYWIRDGKIIRIWDKYLGSATLLKSFAAIPSCKLKFVLNLVGLV